MTETNECCRCHCEPRVIKASGLWYVYCPKCAHRRGTGNIYNICGLTQEKAILQWNELNRHRKLFQNEEAPKPVKKKKAVRARKPVDEKELKTMGSRIQYIGKRYIGIEKLKGGKL